MRPSDVLSAVSLPLSAVPLPWLPSTQKQSYVTVVIVSDSVLDHTVKAFTSNCNRQVTRLGHSDVLSAVLQVLLPLSTCAPSLLQSDVKAGIVTTGVPMKYISKATLQDPAYSLRGG